MPELPEVETRVVELRPHCVGRTIRRARLNWPRHVATPSAPAFRRRIRGQQIETVERRGKFLVFGLNRDRLLIHLRMSGDLRIEQSGVRRGKHDHTIFEFDNNTELRFSDSRKFGRVYLVRDEADVVGRLGPEPLDDKFTSRKFTERVRSHRRPIKPLLLDQRFLAGVGNIYADEALHRARIHPLQRSDTLSAKRAGALWRSVRSVLRAGIRRNGASIDWLYRGGQQQRYFRVYDRAGAVCFTCGALIERIVVGQRSAYFCPHCQPLQQRNAPDE